MERVSVSLIEEIRSALIERYNRDQEIQQMIEEIGAEEGLNEKELTIIHQAYLEVKERMQYTANLMELWNQIEVVQERISMLNSYESLERDLFGDVLSFDKPMGYGTTNHEQLDYAMEKIKLKDIDKDFEDFNLTETYPIHKQTVSSNTLNEDNNLDTEEHLDDENDLHNERVLHKDVRTSLDPFDMVNSLLYAKQSKDDKKTIKQQKEIDKLIKKQLKRVEEEWAKLSGKNTKKDKKKKDKDKDKDKKKDKKEKKSKKEFEFVKESSKSKKAKKDKESKKNKMDMDSKKNKKNKDAKKDQKSKKLEKSLKKESKKSEKKD